MKLEIILTICLVLWPFGARANGVIITELFPNPSSKNTVEWIELHNQTNTWKNLQDWSLKDDKNTYTFKKDFIIQKYSHIILSKRKTKLSLNNQKDKIRLVDSAGKIIQEIQYTKAPKDKSYSLTNQGWEWTKSSPNRKNNIEKNNQNISPKITLTEIFPFPAKNGTEWIELYNPNSRRVNIEGWLLEDNKKKYAIEKAIWIEPQAYFALEADEINLTLNNKNDTLKLLNPLKEIIDQINYTNAQTKKSYTRTENDVWIWTTATKAKPNRQIEKFTGVITNLQSDIFTIDTSQNRFFIENRQIVHENEEIEFYASKLHPYLWKLEQIEQLKPLAVPEKKQKRQLKDIHIVLITLLAGIAGIIILRRKMAGQKTKVKSEE